MRTNGLGLTGAHKPVNSFLLHTRHPPNMILLHSRADRSKTQLHGSKAWAAGQSNGSPGTQSAPELLEVQALFSRHSMNARSKYTLEATCLRDNLPDVLCTEMLFLTANVDEGTLSKILQHVEDAFIPRLSKSYRDKTRAHHR
jgi:hypothetical protein